MNEKPLLFSGEMVRAILDGRKTQTRRLVKLRKNKENPSWPIQPLDILPMNDGSGWVTLMQKHPPKGGLLKYALDPGDRFWVKETFGKVGDSYVYRANFKDGGRDAESFLELSTGLTAPAKWIPSIFMTRKASRINLEIIKIRVERLQDISAKDAKAEGVSNIWNWGPERDKSLFSRGVLNPYVANYSVLWDSLNSKNGFGWDADPWVWVIEFMRI